MRYIRANLGNIQEWQGEAIDAVVHCAATSPIPGLSADRIVRDNVQGTERLINAVSDCKRFVFLSSMSAFGQIGSTYASEGVMSVSPDVYGLTKLLGEAMLQDYGRHGMNGLSIRLPGVLGRGARRNWLSTCAAKMRAGETVTLYNHTAVFNNAVHVDALAEWIRTVVERGWTGYDMVVVGAGSQLTIWNTVHRLARGMGVECKVEFGRKVKDTFNIYSEYAAKKYGYVPDRLEDIIDRYATEV